MLTEKRKTCHYCDNDFIPKTYKHLFCTRECFISHYREEQKENKYPSYVCNKCKKIIELDFYPKLSLKKWGEFKCPYCGAERQFNDYSLMKELKQKFSRTKKLLSPQE